MIASPEYLSSSKAAALLGVSVRTLARHRHRLQGEEGVRIRRSLGGHYTYHEGDLRALAARLSGERGAA